MRNRTTAGVCAGLILVLGACSSGSGTTQSASTSSKPPVTIIENLTTTVPSTLPPAQLKAALKTFFASPSGKALLTFEKVSAPMSTGRTLPPKECQPFIGKLAKIAAPDGLLTMTQAIPDPYLSKKFHDDVALKRLYLATCVTTALPASVGLRLKTYTDDLRALMAKRGFTI